MENKPIKAIILDGKVYEAIPATACDDCAFDKQPTPCRELCALCSFNSWNCAFRLSQTLTDKLNQK